MEDIKNFIELVAQGDNVGARDSIEEVLASRAFDALDSYKKEIASTLFTGKQIEEPATE